MAGIGMRQAHIFLIAACLLTVYAIGASNLKAVPISHSESNSQRHLFKTYLDPAYSLAETTASVSENSAQHGPLYFVLLNLWEMLVGRDLFSLRLLSIFCGLLAVAFTYRLASIADDRNMATVAAILSAFLAFLIFYHQLVRMYSLLTLLVAVVAWVYWRVISTAAAPLAWRWATLVVAAAALVYVHYYGMVLLMAIGLYHFMFAAKARRWLEVCAAMIAAGLLFAPWLPVVFRGWSELKIPSENLSLVESAATVAQVYSNGLAPILALAAAACLARYKRLGPAQRYLLFLALSIFLMIIALNEVTPVLAARRLRYTVILAAPLCCAIAIGFTLLPARRLALPALVILWILACFAYIDSDELLTYTNRAYQNSDAVPSYQDFHYNAASLPSRNALILSFHPDATVDDYKVLAYYRWLLSDWAHVAHITTDASGGVHIQSGLSTYSSPDAIVSNSNGIWVIHNPQQTDLNSLEVYRDWFARNFQMCRRFIDNARSVIAYYLKIPIPCSLVAGERKLEIKYDSGARLGNAVLAQSVDRLAVYLWWLHHEEVELAYSLQAFDDRKDKVLQHDDVISGDPVDAHSLDLSGLPPGAYSLELIVYERQSGASQSGMVVNENRSFERAAELAKFEVES
ncbi:MAG: hypothetical protein F4X02_01115 [Chloroflexi bacterium]|nr:hypothetical protein [Chloroflexota bacterium]